jgi:hypothetical protein
MKKRRKPKPNILNRGEFNPVPTSAYKIRRQEVGRASEHLAALGAAVEEASRRHLLWVSSPSNLDAMLTIAEPFVDKDILRAQIMAEGDPPPGAQYGIAIVPGSDALDPTRWYLLPLQSPAHVILVVPVNSDLYAEFSLGWENGIDKLFTMFQDHDMGVEQDKSRQNRQLKDGALPFHEIDEARRRKVIDGADVVFGFNTNTGMRSLFYGREALGEIVKTGQGKALRVSAFSLDFGTDDLIGLISDVVAVKGSHCYERE